MTRLLLLGGGHAHLMAVPLLARSRPASARIALVAPSAALLYSGMMPGWLAGRYRFDECSIDLVRLCRAHGIEWIEDEIVDLDLARREAVGRRDRHPFELVSVNVGSENDLGRIGAGAPFVLGSKPFARFVGPWDGWRAQALERPGARRLLVVGGGPAGVEIAFALAALAQAEPALAGSSVALASAGARLFEGMSAIAARLAERGLRRHGVQLSFGRRYLGADAGCARFDDGEPIAADLIVVATGARPPAWLGRCAARDGVAMAPDGGLAVRSDLRSTSHAAVFAAGDCASFVDQSMPRSGVHALRQGAVLARNLLGALAAWRPPDGRVRGADEAGSRAADGRVRSAGEVARRAGAGVGSVAGARERYLARRWTLALLDRCDGGAIGAWGPIGFAGTWVARWKERIDRRFVGGFR